MSKTNLQKVITQGLVDLDEMITKSFVANYVSVHDSITLTKMTNCCKSTGQINMTRVVLGLNIS